MSYWDEVKELIKKGTDIAAENIRQGAGTAADKTKEATIAAKGKARIFLKHRDLLNIFSDLGELLYEFTSSEESGDINEFLESSAFLHLTAKADEIKKEISAIAKESGLDEKEFQSGR